MTGKFRVELADEEQATALWQQSPQATAFNRPDLLAALSESVTWWAAWRSEDLVAIWPICQTPEGDFRPPIFSYYVGPMFNQEIHDFKYHRYWAIRQQALEVLVDHMALSYSTFRFSLPLGFTDVRAFTWWNYENSERGHYDLTPRQTARLTELQMAAPEAIRQGFARNRKRDIKSTEWNPPDQVDDWTIEEILALHDAPLERQGQNIAATRRQTMRRLVENVAKDGGKVLAFRSEESEGLASAILLLYGRHDANNVLCVANAELRDTGLTAWTTWQGILQARNDGLDIFDFNGANSPQRAADKHCYGAVDSIYFNGCFEAE